MGTQCGVQGSLWQAVLPLVSQGWKLKSVCACWALIFLHGLVSSSVLFSQDPVCEYLCAFPLPVLPFHHCLSDSVVASSACQPVCLVHVCEWSVHTYGIILKVCLFLLF